MTFGRNTRVKFLGGELLVQETGSLEQWGQQIQGVKSRALNLQPALQAFRPFWFQEIENLFAEEGASENWPPLSPAYADWKSRAAGGQTMMKLTGRLFNSLTSMTSDTIWHATPRTIQFGTRVPYFEYHQEGTGRLPIRRTLVLSPTAYSQLYALVTGFVTSGKIGL